MKPRREFTSTTHTCKPSYPTPHHSSGVCSLPPLHICLFLFVHKVQHIRVTSQGRQQLLWLAFTSIMHQALQGGDSCQYAHVAGGWLHTLDALTATTTIEWTNKPLSVCMHMCMYMYICVCMYLCAYMYICKCVHTQRHVTSCAHIAFSYGSVMIIFVTVKNKWKGQKSNMHEVFTHMNMSTWKSNMFDNYNLKIIPVFWSVQYRFHRIQPENWKLGWRYGQLTTACDHLHFAQHASDLIIGNIQKRNITKS